MFKSLFGRNENRKGSNEDDLYRPHMPEVDLLPDIEAVFSQAREAAAGRIILPDANAGERYLVLVTPGRTLLHKPCPPAGSMTQKQVASIEGIISSSTKRNIAVIACTELQAVMADISKAIPFVGFLMGFVYIGHAVWVFEGHPSALAAGCRDADVLLVDGGMLPFLTDDWSSIASTVMRHSEIYVHDRATFKLNRVGTTK